MDSSKVLEALQLVRASSLNCYMFEALPDDTIETKASLLTQQLELSGGYLLPIMYGTSYNWLWG